MRKQQRWRRFFRRMGWGLIIAVAIVIAPCSAWTPDVFTWWQVPLAVLFLVLYIGVLMFDTFFFNRYP